MASARALASASRRSRFIVTLSVGRRKPCSMAWAADLETVAVETVSKTLATAGIGPWAAPGS
jgi:hypothetical protein